MPALPRMKNFLRYKMRDVTIQFKKLNHDQYTRLVDYIGNSKVWPNYNIRKNFQLTGLDLNKGKNPPEYKVAIVEISCPPAKERKERQASIDAITGLVKAVLSEEQ